MHCDQVRGLLQGFTCGALPHYKVAWVAQHLAGCEDCRALVEALSPAPVSPAAEAPGTDPPVLPDITDTVRRPLPARLWISALLLASLLMVAIPRACLRVTRAVPQPTAAPSPTIPFEATVQRQSDVSLSLKAITRSGNEIIVRTRFLGTNLTPPTSMDAWVTVLSEGRHVIESRVRAVTVDAAGITLDVGFSLPQGSDTFLLRIAGINQTGVSHWSLNLPAPPMALQQTEQSLGGTPPGLILIAYGLTGELLRVHLRAWVPAGPTTIPALSLRDGQGGTYAPAFYRQSEQAGTQELVLEYAIPDNLQTPLTLIGNSAQRRYLGPWLIEAKMVR